MDGTLAEKEGRHLTPTKANWRDSGACEQGLRFFINTVLSLNGSRVTTARFSKHKLTPLHKRYGSVYKALVAMDLAYSREEIARTSVSSPKFKKGKTYPWEKRRKTSRTGCG